MSLRKTSLKATTYGAAGSGDTSSTSSYNPGSSAWVNNELFEVRTFHFDPISASATGDPHFRINFNDRDDICFDFGSTEGQIINLLSDEDSGLVVNGELIDSKDHKAHRLGRIGVISPLGNTLQISREGIVGSGPSGNISFSQGQKFRNLY